MVRSCAHIRYLTGFLQRQLSGKFLKVRLQQHELEFHVGHGPSDAELPVHEPTLVGKLLDL